MMVINSDFSLVPYPDRYALKPLLSLLPQGPKHSCITGISYLCFLDDSPEPITASAPTVCRALKQELFSALCDL